MRTLSDLRPGDKSIVVEIKGDAKCKQKLYELGLTPGILVEFVRTAPFGDPINIKIRGFNIGIRRDIASHIYIEEENNG